MASPTRLDLTRPQTFASDEERLRVLRQAIEDGFASGLVEGDIFEIVRAEFGFPPYEDK